MRKHARSAALATALVAVLGSVLAAGWNLPASAHASLVGSDPEAGQRLDRLPERVTLEFSEPISEPAYVVVTAPDGSRADQDEVRVDGAEVSVALAGSAPEGTYGAAFRVVSEDGHPVTGRISFVVGDGPLDDEAPGAEPSASASASADAADPAPAADRDGDDGGLSLGQVQVGVAVALFAVAAGLLLWSRRRNR